MISSHLYHTSQGWPVIRVTLLFTLTRDPQRLHLPRLAGTVPLRGAGRERRPCSVHILQRQDVQPACGRVLGASSCDSVNACMSTPSRQAGQLQLIGGTNCYALASLPPSGFILDTTQSPQVLSVTFSGGVNNKRAVLAISCVQGQTTPQITNVFESGSPALYVCQFL